MGGLKLTLSRMGRQSGARITSDVAQVLREAMPSFVAELLPKLAPNHVWFVQEQSAETLVSMLILKDDLLTLLENFPEAVNTRFGLRTIVLDPQQIFFVVMTKGDESTPVRIGQGRVALATLRASA